MLFFEFENSIYLVKKLTTVQLYSLVSLTNRIEWLIEQGNSSHLNEEVVDAACKKLLLLSHNFLIKENIIFETMPVEAICSEEFWLLLQSLTEIPAQESLEHIPVIETEEEKEIDSLRKMPANSLGYLIGKLSSLIGGDAAITLVDKFPVETAFSVLFTCQQDNLLANPEIRKGLTKETITQHNINKRIKSLFESGKGDHFLQEGLTGHVAKAA